MQNEGHATEQIVSEGTKERTRLHDISSRLHHGKKLKIRQNRRSVPSSPAFFQREKTLRQRKPTISKALSQRERVG
jgi:hypothetical protein